MRILVIEDEPDLARHIAGALTRQGHTTAVKQDGLQGLNAALDTKPDLIVLDLNLPSLDGFSVLERLRKQHIVMDVPHRKVTRHGEKIELSPREFEVLQIFMREPGRVFTRDEICERIWQREHQYDTRTVEIFIMRLRKKLDIEDRPPLIQTVRGVGYQLLKPE